MARKRIFTSWCLAFLGLALVAVQPPPLDAQALAGRSRIELRVGVGFRSNAGTTIAPGGTTTEAQSSGLLGSIGYAHWLDERVAVVLSVGLLAAEAEVTTGSAGIVNRAATVVPILAGVRYYLAAPAESPWGLFVSGEAGPVIGMESRSEVGTVVVAESRTQGAFDARLGVGVDIQLSRLFMLGLAGGYHFMTDFSEPISGETNHSGPDAGVSISLLLGRAR